MLRPVSFSFLFLNIESDDYSSTPFLSFIFFLLCSRITLFLDSTGLFV